MVTPLSVPFLSVIVHVLSKKKTTTGLSSNLGLNTEFPIFITENR